MKKNLLLATLIACCINSYGQSIKFSNLVYLASLGNKEVFENLVQSNTFKQDYSVDVNGQEIEYFKNTGAKPGSEVIVVGNYTKLYNGTILRTVNYTSKDPQDIINMIAQAKRFGLELKFRGADASSNIYLFDNELYHVSIYLPREDVRNEKSVGLVEIKQKQYLGLE